MPFYKLILNYSIRYVDIFRQRGDLAQLGERFLDVEGVMGSSPLASTIRVSDGHLFLPWWICDKS